ncbi:Uncharacterised protein [Canicola haemoglobinophilus]|uniref:DUF4236 domain-containing protein n=1 Tax=Canicola haemoglobinophilus TaxID=733 RepID=A0AB38H979_9PAST|nr:DUF4236 domain-containing protein [Canicola haemoglobinophilus]STO54391.1 Uncharacterised protein [Canicola haemoglobinophilus]STO68925.1 Uncharacterised protein [Canicola haemoglobinophilus]
MARNSFKNPFKFRKRIKIAPGISINLSKSGISTTVGVKGLSVNLGKDGTYLNAGLPGTGIYTRTKLKGTQPKEEKVSVEEADVSLEPIETNKKGLMERIEDYTKNAEKEEFFYKIPKKYRLQIETLTQGYTNEDYKELSKNLGLKNAVGMIYISLFFGWLGIDRFLIKDRRKGPHPKFCVNTHFNLTVLV